MSFLMKPPKNESGHIHSLGYDAETKTMAVQFTRGGVYHYHGVSAEDFAALHGAESVGSHFRENVLGKFSHTKR